MIVSSFIKLEMLSSQSREFHNFFAQLIVAATTLMVFVDFFLAKTFSRNFASLSHFFALFIFAKKCEISRKILPIAKRFVRGKPYAGVPKLNLRQREQNFVWGQERCHKKLSRNV